MRIKKVMAALGYEKDGVAVSVSVRYIGDEDRGALRAIEQWGRYGLPELDVEIHEGGEIKEWLHVAEDPLNLGSFTTELTMIDEEEGNYQETIWGQTQIFVVTLAKQFVILGMEEVLEKYTYIWRGE